MPNQATINALKQTQLGCRHSGAADPVEAIAAGDEITLQGVRLPVQPVLTRGESVSKSWMETESTSKYRGWRAASREAIKSLTTSCCP